MRYTSQHYCDKKWTLKWPYIANAVFQIVQNHGEKSFFLRFYGGAIAPPGSAPDLHSFKLVASLVNTLPKWPPYATGREGNKRVEDKKSLPIKLLSVQQRCWPQK